MFCETVDKSKLLELLAPSQQLFSVFANLHANLFVSEHRISTYYDIPFVPLGMPEILYCAWQKQSHYNSILDYYININNKY